MYLDAVLKGYRLVAAPRNDSLRRELAQEDNASLVRRLVRLKRVHNTTDTEDRERLIRAIEIAEYETEADETEPFPEIVTRIFGIRIEREILKQRIRDRLNRHLREGMVEEIEALLSEGLKPEQLDFYGLEYRYVTRYVTGEINRNDMVQKLASAIFQFAKKQEKWFRRMQRQGREISWLDGGEDPSTHVKRVAEEVF